MITAQSARQQKIQSVNNKYGRKNWDYGEEEYVQSRQVMRLTKRAFALAALTMLGLVTVVVLCAYAAQIRYNINTIHKENTDILANIDMMKMELEKDRNIIRLEERAIQELGMKYPDSSEVVFLQVSSIQEEGASVAKR